MDASLFGELSTGRLMPIVVDEATGRIHHHAFVPDDLPETIDLAPRTWTEVVSAAEQLGRLDSVTSELGVDPILIAQPTIRREALSTSALEGTFAPAAEVLRSEVDKESPRSPAVTEILNFVKATAHGVERIATLPIGTRLACELQSVLVGGTQSEDYQRGKLRQTQVLIGPYKGCSVKEARYVPPPPGQPLVHGMDQWERWLNRDDLDLHPIVVVAMSHYQFEALHPFTDGNGRIGRLLAILQLMAAGTLQQPLINLSPYFEARAEEYRHRLRTVSTDGEWDQWVTLFARALSTQAREAIVRVRDLLRWRDTTIERLKAAGMRGGVALDLVSSLISSPTVTVRQVAERFEVSVASANTAVNRLVSESVLEEMTGASYNRVFQAPEVVQIIFGPPTR